MITNPHLIQSWHQRFTDRARGVKTYRAGFQIGQVERYSRAKFRTASEADDYGDRLKLRWIRLYDALIASMVDVKEPTE